MPSSPVAKTVRPKRDDLDEAWTAESAPANSPEPGREDSALAVRAEMVVRAASSSAAEKNPPAPMKISSQPYQQPGRRLRAMAPSNLHAPSAMPPMNAAITASTAGISCPSPVAIIFDQTIW